MGKFATVLRTLCEFAVDNQKSIIGIVLALITVGGEQLFRFAVFDCPCDPSISAFYASACIFAPAVAFLFLALLVNKQLWRMMQGCCHRTSIAKATERSDANAKAVESSDSNAKAVESSDSNAKAVESSDSNAKAIESSDSNVKAIESSDANTRKNAESVSGVRFLEGFGSFSLACVMPVAWLFFVFSDGNYYACMRSELPCKPESPEYKKFERESEAIAWIGLAVLLGLTFIVLATVRCCAKTTAKQMKYQKLYWQKESGIFKKLMETKADELAVSNAEGFLFKPDLRKADWDAIAEVHVVDERNDPCLYSSLHKWNEEHKEEIQERRLEMKAKKRETEAGESQQTQES